MNINKRLLSLSILIVFITLILMSIFPLQLNKDENSPDINHTSEEVEETKNTEEVLEEETTPLEEESISKDEPAIETSTSHISQTTQEETTTITYPDLYSDFTKEEIYMIQRVVETETYTADINSKMNVASVVFNRLNHPNNKYGDDIVAIITAPNQFAYWRTEISDTTIEAIERVYKYGDTTNGCMAYRSDEYPQNWYSWELQFVDDVGHGFYKEKID